MATKRQKRAIAKLVETGSYKEMMIEAGYSPNTAKAPTKLTKSKGWQELLKQYLPDNKLLEVHEDALQAVKYNEFTGEKVTDHSIRLKAVELGYKVKGKMLEGNANIIGDKQIIVMNYSNKKQDTSSEPK